MVVRAGGGTQNPLVERDLLFINYAREDEAVALWVAVKLTADGYRTWFDQRQCLGGEPFPLDIETAIKVRTFRMLSVLSRNSMHKQDPFKERAAALNVGQELGIKDFVIPLGIEALSRTDLSWHVSDLSWIDFSKGWAEGYRRLRKKLEAINAPRTLSTGREIVSNWYDANLGLSDRPERLWANLMEFNEIPEHVYKVLPASELPLLWPADWPRVADGLSHWVLEVPGFPAGQTIVVPYSWADGINELGLSLRPTMANLLRQYVLRQARRKGLVEREDGSVYFPLGLLDKNQVKYQTFDDRRTYRTMVANRSFPLGNDRREHIRFHQSFHPWVDLGRTIDAPVVRLTLSLYLTYPGGAPLDSKKAHRRRRRICTNWYNDEWLNRLIAVVSFLADGRPSINLAVGQRARIMLSGRPHTLTALRGIDEGRLSEDARLNLPDNGDDEDDEAV